MVKAIPILILSVFFSFSHVSYADDESGWKIISEMHIDGVTPQTIKPILDLSSISFFDWLRTRHVNTEMSGLRPDVLKEVHIVVSKYEYKGPTTCSPNDPRLTAEADSGSVVYKKEGELSWTTAISEGDPCASSFKKPVRHFHTAQNKS